MGSIAGLYMMGLGGALRWQPDNSTLRANLDAVVDGIAECADNDGFIMAYDKNTTGRTEHPDYVLSWVSSFPTPHCVILYLSVLATSLLIEVCSIIMLKPRPTIMTNELNKDKDKKH